MNKAFTNFTWENDPSVNTPLSAENLNKVKDITAIGKTGIPAINVALQLGNLANVFKPGTKLIKTRNDNPNQIKNIKSEIETMVNQISFSKPGLDPSVFTPNKEYIINADDVYSGTSYSGKYLLRRKRELYFKSSGTGMNEKFILNTMLLFERVFEQ